MKLLQFLSLSFVSAMLIACNNPKHNSNQSSTKAKVNVVSNNIRINYSDTGSGDTTLLFVHGWCLNKTYWDAQVAHFGKRYRVVAIDLPGYGQSGTNRKVWNTDIFGDDIKNVITQLDLKNVVLVGHSMAGDIVLQSAIDIPEKVIAIVGVDNFKSVGVVPKGDTIQMRKEYDQAIADMKKDFKKVAFYWFNQDLFSKTTTKEIKDRILKDVAHTNQAVAIASQEYFDFDEGNKLLQAKKKLYLINSDYQPTDTSGLTAKKIPFKLLEVHATGHFPMVEKPDEFNERLEQVMANLKVI